MKKESVRVCIVNVCIHSKPWEEGDSKGVKNKLTAGTETDRIIYNSDEISSQRMDADRHGRFFWKHVHNNISACAWMCVFAHSGLHSSWFWAPVGGSGTPSGPHGSAGPSSPAHECLQIRWTSTHTHTQTQFCWTHWHLMQNISKLVCQQSDLVWCLFCNTKKKTPFLNLGVLFLHDSNETKWGILPHCKMHVWNSNLVTVFRIKTLL